MNQQVGRYQILEKLGKGAMGVVYLADDPLLKRQVAIKTVEFAADDPARQTFLRERLIRDGRAAAGLSHPNIVSVYDVLEEGDCGYLVMEYIAGESLAVRLARTPKPDEAFTTKVLREVAGALDYTHARGVIHRDIKPANIMIDSGGTAKIMDFGIARISDARTSTPTGMIMGTLEYMAPEQIKGEPVDGHADQFSLAAVAYEMVTGCTLFGEQTFTTLAYKIVNEMPPPPRTHNPGLPHGVDEVVAKALRKAPAERFNTCGDFIAALERAFAGEVPVTGQPTQAIFVPPTAVTATMTLPAPSPAPVSAPPKGRGALIGLCGVLAAFVLGGVLLLWKPWAPVAGHVIDGPPPSPVASGTAPAEVPPQLPAPPPAAESKPVSAPPADVPSKSIPPQASKPATPSVPEPAPEADPSEASVPEAARQAFRRGEAMVKSNHYPAAIRSFTEAIDLRPDFIRAHFARGGAYLHQNRAADALTDYSEVISRNPRNAVAYSQRGICHARLGDESAAMADFDRALQLHPDVRGAYNGRGLIFLHHKQFQKALHEFSEAIRVAPDFGLAYLNRGHTYEAMGNHSASETDLAKAKELFARKRAEDSDQN